MSLAKLLSNCPKKVRQYNKCFDYCMTFTLKPQYYELSHQDQYASTVDDLHTVLKGLKPVEYKLVAELTHLKNIHYHAYVQLTKNYSVSAVTRLVTALLAPGFGYFSIKKCKDKAGWLSYMNKAVYDPNNDYDKIPYLFDPIFEA